MAKTDLKTKETEVDIAEFLSQIQDENVREDCRKISDLMQKAANCAPKMWGTGMIGFGSYQYKYETGREGEWFLVGFSPRKQNLTLYIMDGFEKYDELMAKLGKHKTGKSCLYIKKLSDIDFGILELLVLESIKGIKEKYK